MPTKLSKRPLYSIKWPWTPSQLESLNDMLERLFRKQGAPDGHASTHESGGIDVINVDGLSGVLADAQTPALHGTSHNDGGSDELQVTNLGGFPSDATKYLRGDATFAVLPTLAAGTYTPTLTNVTNVAASTAYQAQYIRVGATITVSGKVDVDPTATGTTKLGISIPVASNFGAIEDCAGVAFASGIAGQGAAIEADATNDRAQMEWIAVDITNQPMFFTFTYQVI